MSARNIALVTVLLGVAGGFSPAPGVAQQEGPQENAELDVHNASPAPVRVYVLQAGHMVPVGTVQTGADTTLSIPATFLESEDPVQVVAERIGGGTWYESEPVAVRASGRVALTVSDDIERSSVSVDG